MNILNYGIKRKTGIENWSNQSQIQESHIPHPEISNPKSTNLKS